MRSLGTTTIAPSGVLRLVSSRRQLVLPPIRQERYITEAHKWDQLPERHVPVDRATPVPPFSGGRTLLWSARDQRALPPTKRVLSPTSFSAIDRVSLCFLGTAVIRV